MLRAFWSESDEQELANENNAKRTVWWKFSFASLTHPIKLNYHTLFSMWKSTIILVATLGLGFSTDCTLILKPYFLSGAIGRYTLSCCQIYRFVVMVTATI